VPKVYETMNLEVIKLRREEMVREAESYRLKKALRADLKRPVVSRWASSVAWELLRIVGLLRKLFKGPSRAAQNRDRP
jgi:hypothetical protein